MAPVSCTWTLCGAGWACCRIRDGATEADAVASFITNAPEEFLEALTRLALGAAEARCEFQAEPEAYRWIFRRSGDDAVVELLKVPTHSLPDTAGVVTWTTRRPVGALTRAAVRAFDQVLTEHGEDGYLAAWRRPFPRRELETLRKARRQQATEPVRGPRTTRNAARPSST